MHGYAGHGMPTSVYFPGAGAMLPACRPPAVVQAEQLHKVLRETY